MQDILGAIDRIGQYAAEGRSAFLADIKTQDAVIRQLSIVGEASSRLSMETRKAYSTIPWRKIVALRNIIVHEYSSIRLEKIWDVIENDLPILKSIIETMIQEIV